MKMTQDMTNKTTTRHSGEYPRCWQGVAKVLAYSMSMARVCLEYAYSMPKVWLEYASDLFLFPHWEQNIPTLGIKHSHAGNKTALRLVVSLLLLMVMGVTGAWGQTWPDGLYYIKIGDVYVWRAIAEKTSGQPYLSGLKQTSEYTDPDTGTKYGTANCSWFIKSVSDGSNTYYMFINVATNQYVVWDHYTSGTAKAVHLETRASEPTLSSDHCFFKIEKSGSNYYIHPDECTNSNRGFNYKGGIQDGDHLRARDNDGRGLIQFYDGTNNTITTAALLEAPTITYGNATQKFAITDSNDLPEGYHILYTTDGSDPVIDGANTQTYNSEVSVTELCEVKAVVERYGVILTEIATKLVGPVAPPIITSISGCGNMVEITSNYDGVDIYYTLDESDPTTNSTLYSEPFAQNANATIKAIAYAGDMSSEIASTDYIPTYSATPTITINGSNVTISGAGTIYYTLDGSDPTTSSTVYTSPINLRDAVNEVVIKAIAKDGTKELSCVAANTFVPAIPGYYAIHQNGKGYLRLNNANVNLSNDGNFHYGNLFDGNGNSIWYVTPQGYLQNGYYYLNVLNGKTLCLSVEPKTKWLTEAIDGDAHGKMHLKTGGLYLCNDNNTITLKESPTAYYNACPITITEKSWSGPSADNLTLQSPQQVTYLRAYYTQKMDYEFYDDAGTKKSESNKDHRVYAKLTYESGGDDKGNKWDINTTSGVIYNKTTSEVDVTATYTIEPADPIAYDLHSTPSTKSIKYTLQPKSIIPDAEIKYLLFSIKAGDDYRYPYDDGIAEGGLVKPNGKGGTTAASVLADPDTNPNSQISWKIQVDDEGFYTFQNASSDKYLYYDETPNASSDYGALRLGANPSDDSYKFRLYKTNNDGYGVCYQIIPYSMQYAVYKSDGVSTGFYVALNNNNYKSQSTKVISLYKADDNSQWCIYKYEAEYRVRGDFSFSGPVSTSATGEVTFTSTDGWYGKYIKESPKTGNSQTSMVISGTYNTDKINYIWTVIGLDDYINHEGWTSREGGVGMTYVNDKKFTFNVTSLPVSPASGVIQLQLRGGTQNKEATTDPYKWSGKKTLAFTIMGNGEITFTDITQLSAITSSYGAYRLTADVSDSPTVTTFSGILDGNGHKVSGITQPLFVTLNNGTVHDLTLENINISSPGNVGAIAGTANGGSRIYNVGILSGSLGSTDGYCGSLVGLLDGAARVINCFNYANITSGTNCAGIVGYNNVASTSGNLQTMVMNCMFYGNITGSNPAPIYGGQNIHNKRSADNNTGLNNYCYFLYDEEKNPYVKSIADDNYHGALGAEERFLNRFEFFRLTLNSTRSMAAFYACGDATQKDMMAKWVLDTSIAPYPVLKTPGYYTSLINPDAANADDIDAENEHRNEGRKLGSLTVSIRGVGGGEQFPAPLGASISTSSLSLNVTDKDYKNYNFNYKKIQLPYYSEVGSGNYTGDRVVTGWKITNITGGTAGTFSTDTEDYPSFNFVDRKCTDKDLYSVSGRVFNQGAYWEVPDGVTSIEIEPYWAKAVYLSDVNYDVTYSGSTKYGVTVAGPCPTTVNEQTVYNTVADAISALGSNSSHTVYDYAVVLVGNYHQYTDNAIVNGGKPITIMSADLDGDHEPDNTLFYYHSGRKNVSPIRFDFLNMPGVGMVKRTYDATMDPEPGIFKPTGWFEITNTVVVRFGQFEYADAGGDGYSAKTVLAPLILQGGIYEQFVSAMGSNSQNTNYILVGGNAWFKNFANGCHTNTFRKTPKIPISVAGGDYTNFYLTGIYQPNGEEDAGNAACYIDGGRFAEVAGAGMQVLKGNVTWCINGADITNFYGGGINAAKPITGNITTTISNSYVDAFYGGPKFGDMSSEKKVSTTATNCHFGKFYGAGYGGTALNRVGHVDNSKLVDKPDWLSYINEYYTKEYNIDNKGISTSYDYEFLLNSNGNTTVDRFFVNYASLSLASTRDVETQLTDCTIGTFYGGGRLGSVNGDITSILTNCTVTGNAFGAGFSAEVPTVDVMPIENMNPAPEYNRKAGVFNNANVEFPASVTYKWDNRHGLSNSSPFYDNGDEHYIYTDVDLSHLGAVNGNATLTIKGNSKIGYDENGQRSVQEDSGNVFGGGDASATNGNTTVTISGNAEIFGNVYGGGNNGNVSGSATVNIQN